MLFDLYSNTINWAHQTSGHCNDVTADICIKAAEDSTVSNIQILTIFAKSSPFHECYFSPYKINDVSSQTLSVSSIYTPDIDYDSWRNAGDVYHVVPVLDGRVLEPQLGSTEAECSMELDLYKKLFQKNNREPLSFYLSDFDEDNF